MRFTDLGSDILWQEAPMSGNLTGELIPAKEFAPADVLAFAFLAPMMSSNSHFG